MYDDHLTVSFAPACLFLHITVSSFKKKKKTFVVGCLLFFGLSTLLVEIATVVKGEF